MSMVDGWAGVDSAGYDGGSRYEAYETFINDIARVIPVIKVDYSRFRTAEGATNLPSAYIVMAYIVCAYIVRAYLVCAYIVMAYIVCAYIVMAYIVMAEGAAHLPSRCSSSNSARAPSLLAKWLPAGMTWG